MSRATILRELRDYTVITISLLIYVFGVCAFLIPAGVVSAGVSGIATLVYFYSNETIPVAIPYLIINTVLVTIGMRLFGRSFGIKTVYAICVTAAFLYIGQKIFTGAIVPEAFMATIIGGMCAGAGVGLAISQGGSTGGTDIIALIVNKYWSIAPGRTMLYTDVIIISCSYLVFGNIVPVIYGFVTLTVTSYFVDFVITGRKQSVQFFIFTEKHEEMAARINSEMGRGVSLIDAYGWHSKKDKKIVMVLCRKVEGRQVMRIVRDVDRDAFTSMNAVTGVYGKGFENIR